MCYIYTHVYHSRSKSRLSSCHFLARIFPRWRQSSHADSRQSDWWAPERVDALRRALKGESDGFTGAIQPVSGPIFAVLFALKQLAERVGLLQALGSDRWAKLVCGSFGTRRRRGVPPLRSPLGHQHAVAETLGLQRFYEDDLYEALDRLAEAQEHIEHALYRRTVRQRAALRRSSRMT